MNGKGGHTRNYRMSSFIAWGGCLKLPTQEVPSGIAPDVMRFCAKIRPKSEPLFVDVVPEPWALPQECFPNVRAQIDKTGGRIPYGWAILRCGNLFIEAEHHAVYDREQEGVFPHRILN